LLTIVLGTPTYVLYYFWFVRRELDTPVTPGSSQVHTVNSSLHRLEVIVAASTWLFVAVAIAGSVWVLVIYDYSSSFAAGLSKFWGIVAAATNTIQWIPQIDATWSAQHEGVLSAASLIISVLVDFFVAAFWIAGPKESIWIYLSLATDAVLQVVLIGMIFFFRIKRLRNVSSHDNVWDSGLSHYLLVPIDDDNSPDDDRLNSEVTE
jgi:hypothetical protein